MHCPDLDVGILISSGVRLCPRQLRTGRVNAPKQLIEALWCCSNRSSSVQGLQFLHGGITSLFRSVAIMKTDVESLRRQAQSRHELHHWLRLLVSHATKAVLGQRLTIQALPTCPQRLLGIDRNGHCSLPSGFATVATLPWPDRGSSSGAFCIRRLARA